MSPSLPFDYKTRDELLEADSGRLDAATARAKNWVAGVTALTGLIASVAILKGPTTTSNLALGQKIVVALLSAGALACLVLATTDAYTAAYGAASRPAEVSMSPIEDSMHACWTPALRQQGT
jgi:hypothetical protein